MQTFLAMFPAQASTHAAEVDHMTILVHWLMLVLFVGWGLFFLFVLFRFRKGANPKASYTGAHGKIAKSTEVAVALIEALSDPDVMVRAEAARSLSEVRSPTSVEPLKAKLAALTPRANSSKAIRTSTCFSSPSAWTPKP